MEAFIPIFIVAFFLLMIFLILSTHRESVASKREAAMEKRLDEYLQYGDIHEYEVKYEDMKRSAESWETKNEQLRKEWYVLRDIAGIEQEREFRKDQLETLKKSIELLRKEKKEEEERLREVIKGRLDEMDVAISLLTQDTSERVAQIDYNPIVDEQDFIVHEEMKLKMSESIRELYTNNGFGKNPYFIRDDSRMIEMSANMSSLLMLYADMVIDKKIGNPYKKGLNKSLEIIDQCVNTLWRRYGKYAVQDSNLYAPLKRKYITCLYEIEQYKAQKSEERKELLRIQREELAAQREIEREIKKAQKDEQDAQAKLEKRRMELAVAKSDAEITRLNDQIARLQAAIEEAQQREERALTMAQQGRAGHVYIISNIGSFGEGVYKIGMTRRAEPMDRVVELGDASVPFPFDVHAMIWTEDAPGLETALHHAFKDRRLNAVNGRKEFFRVTIDEVRTELDKMEIEYHMIENPSAAQYRDSLAIRDGIR